MPKNNFKKFIIFFIFLFLMTSGFGCKSSITGCFKKNQIKPVALNWWGVWETNDDVIDLINGFNQLHPSITIVYRKFRYEDYEKELINALAEDRGPDLFSIPASWIYEYQTKISPQPWQITLPYQEMKGTIKKEPITTIKTEPTITLSQLANQFVEVVSKDVIINRQIYGLPLSLDTLALYYNRDLFNSFGIATPPQNWTEFSETVKKLTLTKEGDQIIQSGAALGTARNIARSVDILSVLMIQNGAKMSNDSGYVTFNTVPEASADKGYNPGRGALEFYTDFANPGKEVYSWNSQMPNSLEAFTQGKVGMFFGYNYHLASIKNLAPKLNFYVVSLPQIEGTQTPINYANYWVVTTSKKSKYPNESWGFINYAIQKGPNQQYLQKTKRPTARRDLIGLQDVDEETPELRIFANQVLTAKSWYHGRNPLLAETFFEEMIENVVTGEKNYLEALNLAVQKINSIL